jgi:hypothetical protein
MKGKPAMSARASIIRAIGAALAHERGLWRAEIAALRADLPARSLAIRGTWTPNGVYQALDVVACNGASFVALRDGPGPCPGEGWQLMAMRGKPGKPGVIGLAVSDAGVLTLTTSDGAKLTADLAPALANLRR